MTIPVQHNEVQARIKNGKVKATFPLKKHMQF